MVQWPELWGRAATSFTSSRPPAQNSSTARTPTEPGHLGHLPGQRAGLARPAPGRGDPGRGTSRQTPSTWAVSTAGPGHRLAAGAAGHQDGQLGVDGHLLLDQQRHAGRRPPERHTAAASAAVGHRPHAPAVVAAAGRLQHDRPAVGVGEGEHRGHGGLQPAAAGRAGRSAWAGTGTPAASEPGRMVRLVHGHAPGCRDPGAPPSPSAASTSRSSRSTSSWSKVTTSQRSASSRRSFSTGGSPSRTSAAASTAASSGRAGQHHRAHAQRAGRLAGHAGKLPGAHDAHRPGAATQGAASLGSVGHGRQTTGRRCEEAAERPCGSVR